MDTVSESKNTQAPMSEEDVTQIETLEKMLVDKEEKINRLKEDQKRHDEIVANATKLTRLQKNLSLFGFLYILSWYLDNFICFVWY